MEQFLLLLGTIFLTTYVVTRLHSQISAHLAIKRFKAALTADRNKAPNSKNVDFTLWSEKRVQAYKESQSTKVGRPLGVLSIPKLRLEVPVFAGTDERTLDVGAGWIEGTAKPGQTGNIGIAGHRDGFFRGLKDVGVGDRLDLVLPDRTDRYVVDEVHIVNRSDVSVLQPRIKPSLTLVTCYPFYFIGSAPQRYIVHASLTDIDQPGNILSNNGHK
jgi:sortase A